MDALVVNIKIRQNFFFYTKENCCRRTKLDRIIWKVTVGNCLERPGDTCGRRAFSVSFVLSMRKYSTVLM